MRRFISIGVLALSVTACLGSDFADSVEGPWQLVSGTVDGVEVPILETNPITIVFEGDQVSGVAACNNYSGPFALDAPSIEFGNLVITEMACLDEEVMEAESLYMLGLIAVDTIALEGTLTLSGPGVELVFEPTG